MPFSKYYLAILISYILSLGVHAELLLLESTSSGLNAIDFASADDEKKQRLTDIYRNILNRYQFPMLTMHYALEDNKTKQLIDKLLTPITGAIPEETLVNHFLNEKYGDEFKAIYVPATMFEASAIMTIIEDIDEQPVPKRDEKDPRLFWYFKDSFPRELAKSFLDYPQAEASKLENQDPRRAKFLLATYGPFNLKDEVVSLYFKAVANLINTASLDLLHKRAFLAGLEEIFKRFDASLSSLNRIVQEKASHLANPFFGKVDKFLEAIFRGDDGRSILRNYLQLEADAAKNAQFLLSRGTGGLSLNERQFLLDLPYMELKSDFDEIVKNNEEIKNFIATRFQLHEPDKLQARAEDATTYRLVSLSFSNSILAGTIGEIANEGGARTLDYLSNSDQIGYSIRLGIVEYLQNDALKDAFLVTPLNAFVSLMASGEYFHPRSKVSFFNPEKNWSYSIKGIETGFYLYNDSKLALSDFIRGWGVFTAPSKDWTTLAGHISDTIGQRAELFFKGSDIKHNESEIKASQRAAAAFLMNVDALKKGILKAERRDSSRQEIWKSVSIVDALLRKLIEVRGLSIFAKEDTRFYNRDNVFFKIARDPENAVERVTRLVTNQKTAFVIEDIRPRTNTHLLAIPKGKYISLPHFSAHAKPQEMTDLFRAIAKSAEANGLDKTGYRIITNHAQNPRGPDDKTPIDNHANQEIPHMHVHIAGGECLGKSVSAHAATNPTEARKTLQTLDNAISELKQKFGSILIFSSPSFPDQIFYPQSEHTKLQNQVRDLRVPDDTSLGLHRLPPYMGMNIRNTFPVTKRSFPWGIGLSEEEFIALIKQNLILTQTIDTSGIRLLVYKIPAHAAENIPVYLGATILDSKDKMLYKSIHDFAKTAPPSHIEAIIKTLTSLAAIYGMDHTGYRLMANHGADAWQIPRDIFQIFIAGGKPLGITVTNVVGNKRPDENDRAELDYSDLTDIPHLNCPDDPARALMLTDDVHRTIELNQQTKKELSDITNKTSVAEQSLAQVEIYTDKMVPEGNYKDLMEKIITARRDKTANLNDSLSKIRKELRSLKKAANALPKDSTEANEYKSKVFSFSSPIEKISDYLARAEGATRRVFNIKYAMSGDWIFIDLDNTLIKGFDSTDLTENDLLNKIKELQSKGAKILALTNRHYWPTMGEEGTTAYKNTFALLKKMDSSFSFSNPGNLSEKTLDEPWRMVPQAPGEDTRYFKDGVIFCADNTLGKGTCLKDYLLRLAKETTLDMPDSVQFIDDQESNVKDVVSGMQAIGIPVEGLQYIPN